jgi:type IX secretion system PorP/SprF family membrane protein
MIKKTTILIAFIGAMFQVDMFAQQDPQYSQYMFNTLVLNPAYAGSRNVVSLTGLGRMQWVGIEGAPRTQNVTIDAPIMNQKMGIGLSFSNDRIGFEKRTSILVPFSYRLMLKKGVLSFGIQAGAINYKSDNTSIKLHEQALTTPPDAAFANNVSGWKPNVGAGIYYTEDKFYIGASLPKLLNYSYSGSGKEGEGMRNHAFLMAGALFNITDGIKLKPSTVIKYVKGSPIQADINANLWFNNKFAVGLSYRTNDCILAMFEMQLNDQLRLGYAFDYTLTSLNKAKGFAYSHELMLRYEFGFNSKKIVTPRYF